jgi:hypothetical protein
MCRMIEIAFQYARLISSISNKAILARSAGRRPGSGAALTGTMRERANGNAGFMDMMLLRF